MTPFITSKYGTIKGLKFYNYKFSSDLIKQPKIFLSFKNWLRYNESITVSIMDDHHFTTLSPLDGNDNWQYVLLSIDDVIPPIKNIQLVSRHIANLVHDSFSEHYKRFFKKNEYVFKKIDLGPFKLNRTISFSVEVFQEATFHINFCPQTRITSSSMLTIEYLELLKSKLPSNCESSDFTVIEMDRLRRINVDLQAIKATSKIKQHLKEGKKFVATFDYKFVSSFSKELFYELITKTRKDVDDSIFILQEVLKKLQFDKSLNTQSKPFYKIKTHPFGNDKELLIGSNTKVNKQSAAHYKGVYRPAKNAVIQPILVDTSFPNLFKELFYEFNGTQSNSIINEPIIISTKELNFKQVLAFKNNCSSSNYVCPIFAPGFIPNEVIALFRENRIQYQIFSGSPQRAKLANFTIRCIEKTGGLLSVINNIEVDKTTYFIGVDLGHDRLKRTSNIAFSYYNYQGELIHYNVTEDLELNEAITSDICQNLDSFRSLYKKGKIVAPERIILHRDGRIHVGEIDLLVDHIQRHFDVYDIEILEIIKSGFPVIAGFDQGVYVNLNSGDAYIDDYNKYSILITNTQSSLTNSLVKPIIVKHKYGEEKMQTLVKQVYWFTKVYTNNLYRSTRLPATTLKANNIVGTGAKEYSPSYLG